MTEYFKEFIKNNESKNNESKNNEPTKSLDDFFKDEEWVDKQLSSIEESEEYIRNNISKWNTTSIVYLAHMSKMAPREDQREKCVKILKIIYNLK
jgi:hypothetical protein